MADAQFDLNGLLRMLKTQLASPPDFIMQTLPDQQKQMLQQNYEQMQTPAARQARAQTIAVIESMTEEERAEPDILTPERIQEIAEANNTNEKNVNDLLNQFRMIRQMMGRMFNGNQMVNGSIMDERVIREILNKGLNRPTTPDQNEEPDPDQ